MEHYEHRNDIPPPKGTRWSSDREYYPDHQYLPPYGVFDLTAWRETPLHDLSKYLTDQGLDGPEG